jgi:hypothetical protein
VAKISTSTTSIKTRKKNPPVLNRGVLKNMEALLNTIRYNLLLSSLFCLTAHAVHIDVNEVRASYRKSSELLPVKIAHASLGYGMLGYGLKGIGNVFHRLSGTPAYKYDDYHFGQPTTIKYPSLSSNLQLSRIQKLSAQSAKTLLNIGSFMHWPNRSAYDFVQGVISPTFYISHVKRNVQQYEDWGEDPTLLINNMKKIRIKSLKNTAAGMALGVLPPIAYHTYQQSIGCD